MDCSRWPEVRDVLSVDQFERTFLDRICILTQEMRELCDRPDGKRLLMEQFSDRSALLYFTQPSSRTHTSFTRACQKLGVNIVDIRDPSTSSEVKGESKLDSLRTFASYVDLIVMRCPEADLARQAAAHLAATPRPRPIVNAGSGADEHPTQALLDIYTMARSFKERGGIDGKTIALVGDLKRGRTVRSLARLMHHYHDMTLLLVSPPAFRMEQDILDHLDAHRDRVRYEVIDDLREATRRADCVYMTRVQDEHDDKTEKLAKVFLNGLHPALNVLADKLRARGNHSEALCDLLEAFYLAAGDLTKDDASARSAKLIDGFCFTPEHLRILRPDGIVMHPLPRREELDPACDEDPRVKIWRQERNGMWVRTALLACIFNTQRKERGERKERRR